MMDFSQTPRLHAMKLRPSLLSALSLALAAMPLHAADKVTMRQHWEPGKVYHLETNMDMDMSAPAIPGAGGQTTTVIQQLDITVSKEPGTDRKLAEMKFAAIKAMINAAGQLMTYDSTDPAMSQPMLQQAFGALLGKSVTVIYDKDDKFVDVIVPDNFMPTPLGQGSAPNGKQLGSMLRESVDFGLPTQSLAVGETFDLEKKIDMQPMGSITTKIKGRLDSIVDHEGRKHAKIVSEGTMEMPSLPPEVQAVVSMLPGAKITSETLFDLDRKVVSRNTTNTEMKMAAGGREMTMKQTMISKLKSIEDAPAKK
jgi:hypothetical protein